ncbi:Phosphoglycerate mutase family protein [Rhynchospora pubera]|uniref:Phosphoglycerate mutase family protein n=1 Tax=Rhynchospora pubera TaxID=906938 RepID=A0AAV8GJN0_9POAL|nr:Phosphoglycerate mutase family protein [Rhynchospora pubera]
MAIPAPGDNNDWLQRVVVMRHGDRIDQFNDLWTRRAERPWDPPLATDGLQRAWSTGRKLRRIGFPITRAVVSPFTRCLQTASEAVSALCAVVNDEVDLLTVETSKGVRINPCKVKMSIEYGLCEVFNELAMSGYRPKSTESWFPNISDLQDTLPKGTIDHDYDRLLDEMPQFGETVEEARIRYNNIIQAIANMHPRENILLVTHGEAVGASVTFVERDSEVFEVDYCGYTVLERQVSMGPTGEAVPGEFKVVSKNGTDGVQWAVLSENA